MATAKKNPITNKWDIQIRYKDSFGNNKKTTRRGFDTKKEAERAAYDFIKKQEKDFNMLFSDFIDIYMDDMKGRLKENTVRTKNYIINLKILPYFAKFKVSEITPGVCGYNSSYHKSSFLFVILSLFPLVMYPVVLVLPVTAVLDRQSSNAHMQRRKN